MADSEITKVRLIIRHFLWQTREVVLDPYESQKWLQKFRDTLAYQDLEVEPDQYALAIIAEARSFNDKKKRNQQMRWVREALVKEGIKNPTEDQLSEKWLVMYGNENLDGDASTREDEDTVRHGHTAAGAAHTTVSNAMGADAVDGDTTGATTSGESRRDRASATSASAPLTCNTADTVPQRGSKSGKTYDQDADNIDDKHNDRGADSATREGAEAKPSGDSRAAWASGQSAPRTFKGHKFKAPTKEELYAYAQDNGLDESDARDCWEMCESRQWADRDGVQIENWKTFVAGFCKSRKAKRSA